MPTVMYPAYPVFDPATGEPLLTIRGEAGRVVQRGTETDVTLVDSNGLPMSQPLYVTDQGFLPTFGVVEGLTQVDFVSGDVRMPIFSPTGLEASAAESAADADASRVAAELAAATAQVPADEAVDAGIARADIPGQIATATDTRVATLVNAQVPPLVASTIGADATVVNAAAAAVQNAAVIAQITWTKPALPTNQDLNLLYTPGVYRVSNFATMSNVPTFALTGAQAGFLTVTNTPGNTWAVQDLVKYGPNRERFWRASRSTGGDWMPWQRTDVTVVLPLASGNDWSTFKTPGLYAADTTSVASGGINAPAGIVQGILEVKASTNFVYQQYVEQGASARVFRRSMPTATNVWTSWAKTYDPNQSVTPTTTVDDGPYRREDLLSRHEIRRGGTIGTAGKAAVAFRFDHHLDSFVTKILPLLKKYDLPWAQVINPERVGTYDDNITWTDLQSLCIDSGGEIWNHGGNHADAVTKADVYTQIVTSLETLRTNLPLIAVENWAPPGLSDGGYMGASPFKTTAQNTGTYAGQLIMANHALVAGYAPGMYRPLNGKMGIGAPHYTIETSPMSTVTGLLDGITARVAGLCLMIHPNYLDEVGYMTTETLEAVFADVAARRDAGTLQVLSLSGLGLADSGHSRRHDMAPSGQVERAVGAGVAHTVSVAVSRVEHHLGSPREILVTIDSIAATTCTIRFNGGPTTTHQVPAGSGVVVRKQITLPVSATNMPIVVTPAASLTIKSVKVLAV